MGKWFKFGFFIFAIILVVIGYFVYTSLFPVLPVWGVGEEIRVADGDTIKVDYIGKFENGRVFDTSILEVAKDNITYPKAISFKLRRDADYKPLEFTVGAGTMIKGFEEGVIGMRKGDVKVLKIPPEKGYGNGSKDLIKTIPVYEEIPLKMTFNETAFSVRFGTPAKEGIVVKDPFWKWDVYVIAVSEDLIIVMNNVSVGTQLNAYGWESEVIERDSSYNAGEGRIVIRHNPTLNITINTEDVAKYVESLSNIPELQRELSGEVSVGIVTAITSDEITIDFNREVCGKTLLFTVKIIDIKKPV
jgi:FKBP-type peptidyl-prolyl cis-trans isomerase 2